MPRAKKPTTAQVQSAINASCAKLRARVNAHTDELLAAWPVVLRVGEYSPIGENDVWTEAALRRLASLWHPTLQFRAGDLALVVDPASLKDLNQSEEAGVRQWRDDLIWGTSELWKERTVSYSAVWLLLFNLLNNSKLGAGELMSALQCAGLTHTAGAKEVISVGDSRYAECAHRLVQAFLLKP